MKTIRQLLGLCEHKWKTISVKMISQVPPSDRKNTKAIIGHEYILQCEKCGNVKNERLV